MILSLVSAADPLSVFLDPVSVFQMQIGESSSPVHRSSPLIVYSQGPCSDLGAGQLRTTNSVS